MEALKKNIIFVMILVLIIGVGLYWMTSRGGDSLDGEEGIVDQPSQYADVRAEILGTVAKLQGVRLDITVLDDPAFRSLTEVPRPWEGASFGVGRRNPFQP